MAVPNGCSDLNELSLPTFNNSTKEAVARFLRELDKYFALSNHQMNSNFPFVLGPSRILLPNRGWRQFDDTVGLYENFKTSFVNLLWGQPGQAQKGCSIYQDRWDRRNEETYAEHYIRYASMVSMLDPPKFGGGHSWSHDRSFSAGSTKRHGLRELKDNSRHISDF